MLLTYLAESCSVVFTTINITFLSLFQTKYGQFQTAYGLTNTDII